MKRICTILARRGSVGLPGKNVRPLGGTPLVARSIRHAQQTGLFDAIVVSSDDPLVWEIARGENIHVIVQRPPELATSEAPKIPGIRHAVSIAESEFGSPFDVVVDLQPTSPLRETEDILGSVRLLESGSRDANVVTGCRSHKSPYFDIVEINADGFAALVKGAEKPVNRRQDAPVTYGLNGSIYAWWRDHLFSVDSAVSASTRLFVMPAERSVDIDTELDFAFAEFLSARETTAHGLATEGEAG